MRVKAPAKQLHELRNPEYVDYCDAVNAAKNDGHSFIDIYNRSLCINTYEKTDKDYQHNTLDLAAFRLAKAISHFTNISMTRKKRLVTKAFRESADTLLSSMRDIVYEDIPKECQVKAQNIPKFESMYDAKLHLNKIGSKWRIDHTKNADESTPIYECRSPNAEVITELLIQNYPMAVSSHTSIGGSTLYFYDYDSGLYTTNNDLLAQLIVQINGSVSDSLLKHVASSLKANNTRLRPYLIPPKFLLKVKNGVFNLITRKMEPPEKCDLWTFDIGIDCRYIPKKMIPRSMHHGYTFDRLVSDLSNGNSKRERLLKQICKSIMTGVLPSPAIFIIQGQGGDGKSLFFDLMANIIGDRNTAPLNFSMLKDRDKSLGLVGAKFTYGTDNANDVYLSNADLLKAIATQNAWAFSRKYYEALYAWIRTICVQLCNSVPRFGETGIQMQRRMVGFKAEKSHSLLGSEDRSLPDLIRSTEFQEYILAEILDEDKNPYYSDFNDVDRDLIFDSMNAEDLVKSFIQHAFENGAFAVKSLNLPTAFLYYAFKKWCAQNQEETQLSQRSFTKRFEIIAKRIGCFKRSDKTTFTYSLLYDDITHYNLFMPSGELDEEAVKILQFGTGPSVFQVVEPVYVRKEERYESYKDSTEKEMFERDKEEVVGVNQLAKAGTLFVANGADEEVDYKFSDEVTKYIKDNHQAIKDKKPLQAESLLNFEYRRYDRQCTSYEYFGMYDKIINGMMISREKYTEHQQEIALYLYEYGDCKTIDEMLGDPRTTYLDIDEELAKVSDEHVSFYKEVTQKRIDEQLLEAKAEYDRRLGFSEFDERDKEEEEKYRVKSYHENGEIDESLLINKASLKLLKESCAKNKQKFVAPFANPDSAQNYMIGIDGDILRKVEEAQARKEGKKLYIESKYRRLIDKTKHIFSQEEVSKFQSKNSVVADAFRNPDKKIYLDALLELFKRNQEAYLELIKLEGPLTDADKEFLDFIDRTYHEIFASSIILVEAFNIRSHGALKAGVLRYSEEHIYDMIQQILSEERLRELAYSTSQFFHMMNNMLNEGDNITEDIKKQAYRDKLRKEKKSNEQINE